MLSSEKLKILFLASNPDDQPGLRLDEEVRAVEVKLDASEHRNSFDLVSKWAARPDDLLQHLNAVKPAVVHFSGHGSRTGELILMDDTRRAKPVSPQALQALFSAVGDNVRIVVLNACYSQAQAEAISTVVDCVIGMSRAISDAAAIKFAASFYRAIGFGRSAKNAFDQSRVSLMLEGIPEQDTPQLLIRAGVDPNAILLVQDSGEVSIDTQTSEEFSPCETCLDFGASSQIPINETREVLAMIRWPTSDGLRGFLERDAARVREATSYTVHASDVKSLTFTMFFRATGRASGQPTPIRIELRAPGLEVYDSPATLGIRRSADTSPVSFLVRSTHEGEQTLKIKVTCDDEELINGLLRTKFVQHGGPGGPGGLGAAYVEEDQRGRKFLVLAEAEFAVSLVRLADRTSAVGSTGA